MLTCDKCNGRVFVDRAFSEYNHIEIFCIRCGKRKFYHNFDKKSGKAALLWQMEKKRAEAWICQ